MTDLALLGKYDIVKNSLKPKNPLVKEKICIISIYFSNNLVLVYSTKEISILENAFFPLSLSPFVYYAPTYI